VWKWFYYSDERDKSACLADDEKGEPCVVELSGKNFSLCGRRNRMWKSLEMRVFLKLNAHIVS